MSLIGGFKTKSVNLSTVIAVTATVMAVGLAITAHDHQDRIEALEKRLNEQPKGEEE